MSSNTSFCLTPFATYDDGKIKDIQNVTASEFKSKEDADKYTNDLGSGLYMEIKYNDDGLLLSVGNQNNDDEIFWCELTEAGTKAIIAALQAVLKIRELDSESDNL
jgi:hypothetical protein